MKRRNMIEWTAFAVGVALSVAIWLSVHPNAFDHKKNSESVSIVESRVTDLSFSESSNTSDKSSPRTDETTLPQRSAADDPADPPLQVRTAPEIEVRVYIADRHRIEKVSLEAYVRGVVAGEMPPSFEPAALEAQALAARTYIVRRLMLGDRSEVPVPDADVTDTQTHQVYRTLDDMDKLRNDDKTAWLKIGLAAGRTEGRIIAYDGQPIQALYFSTSNGRTENSEDVFPQKLPYLRSVESPWDREGAPRSEETVEMPLADFFAKLGVRTLSAARFGSYPTLRVTGKTAGGRVKTMTAGDKKFTGVEIREKLELRSAAFTWSVKGGKIKLTTFGSGHGVGMSQWGAEGMAKAGFTAEKIVKHYYSGTELMEVSKLADVFDKAR